MNIRTYLAPKATDNKYSKEEMLKISTILRTDSYKFAHPFAYKKGITGMSSYGCSRLPPQAVIVPVGIQMFAKKYLMQRITSYDVKMAEDYAMGHFGYNLFAKRTWDKIVHQYDGYLPLIVRAVPEGMPVRGGDPIYTVTALDEDFFWLSSGIETALQRGVWYPTTIATEDRERKLILKHYYMKSGVDLVGLDFALHDFGARGVSSAETAEIGGMAHLVNFKGSDTIEGVLAANFYYKHSMAGFSVYATEHSVECSFGKERENAVDYIRHQLRQARPGSILSIVLDAYDVYREAEICCTDLRDEIVASNAKVVFRPDSGDMEKTVPTILNMQAKAFGYDLTSNGFKKPRVVGLIQGDGVNTNSINQLLHKIVEVYGFSADSLVFGSGGALLQKVDRDTLKFAQKASAIEVDGNWIGIAKNPVTDPGKKSNEGIMTLARHKETGKLLTTRLDKDFSVEHLEDIHQLVYHTGNLYNETPLEEIRSRAAV
jgi:nicotinamide phosphoribosyltransferase